MTFLRRYYQAHVFEDEPGLLPVYGQVALCVEQALALEESDPRQALERYGRVPAICPEWANVVKSYAQAFGRERERREQAARDEMEKLTAQILENVHRCLVKKEYTTALEILRQLKQTKPNDLELAELGVQIRLTMLQEA
jgi:hypothetical protein